MNNVFCTTQHARYDRIYCVLPSLEYLPGWQVKVTKFCSKSFYFLKFSLIFSSLLFVLVQNLKKVIQQNQFNFSGQTSKVKYTILSNVFSGNCFTFYRYFGKDMLFFLTGAGRSTIDSVIM